jgi:hypothetical protein
MDLKSTLTVFEKCYALLHIYVIKMAGVICALRPCLYAKYFGIEKYYGFEK